MAGVTTKAHQRVYLLNCIARLCFLKRMMCLYTVPHKHLPSMQRKGLFLWLINAFEQVAGMQLLLHFTS